jgi:rhamnulokinase
VDYALLGESGELLRNPLHYRNIRNVSAMEELLRVVPREEIYRATGTQFLPFNTIYQLFAAMRDTPKLVAAAEKLVMIPDLLHYWMTGNAVCEYTNASTTQLMNPHTRTWAPDLMHRVGLPAGLLAPIVEPGSVVGKLRRDLTRYAATQDVLVIAPASHDTGSAVAAITARGNTAFLSSGTWSLLGIELDEPVISAETLRLNFTNEGGAGRTTRFLKNVMGLWLLQACRRSWAAQGQDFPYAGLAETARTAPPFRQLIDPDDGSFLNPADMPVAIDRYCAKTDQPIPDSPGSYARTILESLALKYRFVLRDLETLTKRRITQIRVMGGGSKNHLLNQFTADATGCRVLAGPTEAAVLGNIGMQMVATGALSSIAEMRQLIDRSFPTEIFEPKDTARWDSAASRFQHYCEFTYA